MRDSYLHFSNTKFGAKLTSLLGLPQPLHLARCQTGYSACHSQFTGRVLLGASVNRPNSPLSTSLSSILSSMGATVFLHRSAQANADLADLSLDQKVDALVFDASELASSDEAIELYGFFNSTVKSIRSNGRVVVFGRPPELCTEPKKAVVQRALEGLTRSLAKELRRAITVQLVYVEEAAEPNIESTLRFFLSARSTYVSAQVVRVSQTSSSVNTVDWDTPLQDSKHGPKVLITGASQGIGLATAEVMARDGAHVVCLDIPQAQTALEAAAKRLNGSSIVLDVTRDDASQQLAEYAKNDGGWGAVVHNAGITRDKTIAKMSEQSWSQVVQVNLSAQERINDALVSSGGLKPGGRIICVSSISGIAGNRGQTNYALSKAGVIGLVQTYAPILNAQGISINAVAPGFIETEMTAAMPFSMREAGRRLNSLSQGGLPVDVAETIAWLASSASSGLTGNVIRVCGQSFLGA